MGATGEASTSWRSCSAESRLLRKSLAVSFVMSCQHLVQQGQPPTAVQLQGQEQQPMQLLSCMCLAKQGAGLLQRTELLSLEQAPACASQQLHMHSSHAYDLQKYM